MCRHCERLVEDAEDKELMHNFMAKLAEKVNRKLSEQPIPSQARPVTANDLDIHIDVKVPRDPRPPSFDSNSAVQKLLFRDLTAAFE